VGVSQRGHCTCLPQTSNQPHSGPRLALPCRLCRAATGYGSACPDSHRSCGHGRNRCRFRGSLWGVGVQVGGCRGGCWSARRGGLSRARRGGLDRGTGGDRRGRRRPRNGRGTGGCRGVGVSRRQAALGFARRESASMSAGPVNITVLFRVRQGSCLYDFPFIRAER
jgi:hypothetical protein